MILDQSQNDFVYFGFWKRILMRVIDFGILLIPYLILYRLAVILSTNINSLVPYIVLWIISCSFYVVTVYLFGGTPGKLLMKGKIVDREGNKLTISKSILRCALYISYGLAMIFAFNDEILNNSTESPFQFVARIVGFIAFISDIFVIFNKRKKALHDYLAGSVVIKKGL